MEAPGAGAVVAATSSAITVAKFSGGDPGIPELPKAMRDEREHEKGDAEGEPPGSVVAKTLQRKAEGNRNKPEPEKQTASPKKNTRRDSAEEALQAVVGKLEKGDPAPEKLGVLLRLGEVPVQQLRPAQPQHRLARFALAVEGGAQIVEKVRGTISAVDEGAIAGGCLFEIALLEIFIGPLKDGIPVIPFRN